MTSSLRSTRETNDRGTFIAEAIRRVLHDSERSGQDEIARINDVGDELNEKQTTFSSIRFSRDAR